MAECMICGRAPHDGPCPPGLPDRDERVDADYEIVDELKDRPRKWLAGAPVTSVDALLAASQKGMMLWTNGRPFHSAWVVNKAFGPLLRQIAAHQVRYAVINPTYINWLRAELKAAEEAYS